MAALMAKIGPEVKTIAGLNALVYLLHGAPELSDRFFDITGVSFRWKETPYTFNFLVHPSVKFKLPECVVVRGIIATVSDPRGPMASVSQTVSSAHTGGGNGNTNPGS